MSSSTLPVIIAGGGIGGLTSALAFAKKGIQSVVLEQSAQFKELGAGFQLCPNVFKMFNLLGIVDSVYAIASYPDSIIFHDIRSGVVFLQAPYGKNLIKRFHYPHATFHRGELLSVLFRECKKQSLITLQSDARVVDFKEESDRVRVRTEKGDSFEGAVLVGADGIWSTVREMLFGFDVPKITNRVCYRGVIPIEKVPKHLISNNVVHWVGEGCQVVHYPIAHDTLFNIFVLHYSNKSHDPKDTTPNVLELQECFKTSRPEVLELLSLIDTSRMWILCDRDPISTWTKGRVTLLGDAAHPPLPHMTQGAAIAIEDALVLADKVQAHGKDYSKAFSAYEESCTLRAARVLLTSRFNEEVLLAGGISGRLRNEILGKWTPEDFYKYVEWAFNGINL